MGVRLGYGGLGAVMLGLARQQCRNVLQHTLDPIKHIGLLGPAPFMYISIDLLYTAPKAIDFPRYNMKCSGEKVILRGIFHVVPISFSSTFHVISRKFE